LEAVDLLWFAESQRVFADSKFVTRSPISGIVEGKGFDNMNVTIEIPEDRAAYFQKQAQARGLSVERWLLELAEQNAPADSIVHLQKTNQRVGPAVRCMGGQPQTWYACSFG